MSVGILCLDVSSFRNDIWFSYWNVFMIFFPKWQMGYPIKMITYNFEMIKNDCHFEMKSHRLIIERRFFASGVPAVLCVIRTSGRGSSRITHKTVGWKKSPIKIECKQSLWNDEWVTYWYDCANFSFDMIDVYPFERIWRSLRNNKWLSLRNEQKSLSRFEMIYDCHFEIRGGCSMLISRWYMTVVSKWRRKILVTRIILVHKWIKLRA